MRCIFMMFYIGGSVILKNRDAMRHETEIELFPREFGGLAIRKVGCVIVLRLL